MSPKLQPVRGTHDILPKEFEKFHAVVTIARELATLYGFQEMITPIFEATEVFARSMGETSDVVSKEMFTFQTKGEESVTLRPEFTAGIIRAFIFNGMQQHLPLKLFSTGPAFRYERPQKGRQRQFHQVNYEWLGEDNIGNDLEVINLAGHLLYWLSGKKGSKLFINTLGDKESRSRYREVLMNYLLPYAKELSEDSQRRLIVNPLRILDSKSAQDQKFIADAPKLMDYLSAGEKKRFNDTCDALDKQLVSVAEEIVPTPRLVRGLDYYTGLVFEFVSDSGELGAQNTVLAGGRYNGLAEIMGGKPVPAIGFAAGVERLLLLMAGTQDWKEKKIPVKIFILPENVDERFPPFIASAMREIVRAYIAEQHVKCEAVVDILWTGNLGKKMGKASQKGATHVVILGQQEFEGGFCTVKDMKTGVQSSLSVNTGFEKLEKGIHAILDVYIKSVMA